MGMPESFICEAKTFADGRTHCGRCDLVAGDAGKLVCKTPAECGLTLSVILAALADEADRIDGSNDAAAKLAEMKIKEGQKVERGPYRDRLRRAAELRAGIRALEHFRSKRAGASG